MCSNLIGLEPTIIGWLSSNSWRRFVCTRRVPVAQELCFCGSQSSWLQILASVWKVLFSVSSILTACILGSLLDVVLQCVTIVDISTSVTARRLESSIAFKCGWMETLHKSFQNKSAIWQNTLTQVPLFRKMKSSKKSKKNIHEAIVNREQPGILGKGKENNYSVRGAWNPYQARHTTPTYHNTWCQSWSLLAFPGDVFPK